MQNSTNMLRDKWNGCKMDSLGIWQIWSREDDSRSIGESWFSRHQEDQGPSYLDPWKGILDLLSHPHIHASRTGRGIRRSETVGYSKLSIFRRGRRDVELSQARNNWLYRPGKGWERLTLPAKTPEGGWWAGQKKLPDGGCSQSVLEKRGVTG